MNRRQRRLQAANERHIAHRASVSCAMARIIVDELVAVSAGQEPNAEAGIVDKPNIIDLKPIALPAAFIRSLILARPIVVEGVPEPFVRAGVIDSGQGWAVEYRTMGFILRGTFRDDISAFRSAISKLDFATVASRAQPSGRHSQYRQYAVEELQCDGCPIGFASPYHPDPTVDQALREAAIRVFWSLTN
jgi:hypothetical protein